MKRTAKNDPVTVLFPEGCWVVFATKPDRTQLPIGAFGTEALADDLANGMRKKGIESDMGVTVEVKHIAPGTNVVRSAR